MPFSRRTFPTNVTTRPRSGSPSSRRAARRSAGRKSARSTPLRTRTARSRGAPSAASASTIGRLTPIAYAADRSALPTSGRTERQRATTFTSVPWAFTA
ncbi:hypothetical protein BE21_46470 [Sorangium cellulosum]|uniref:Uncharacterized protein n=1 Tax=Sorangium cellulosum TaxID=56 RepID=A0A150TII6_SORCE|nr:hypothetical protein BE21_46470 [Sorangium cellulosum]